jgi:hypothetical protein
LVIALVGGSPPCRDEVRLLISLFPPDGVTSFGLAWSLFHFIEDSPDWPDWGTLRADRGWWSNYLAYRLRNGGVVVPDDLAPRDIGDAE